jgi:acyl-CoA synthetase (NDP forming)
LSCKFVNIILAEGDIMIDGNIFSPRSVAVIGASSDPSKEKEGYLGRLLSFGYKGNLYPINPKATEIFGLKTYPSVKNVPQPIDYAIFNVSSALVPKLLMECAEKKVKVAHVFTSGFKESGDPEGIKIEEEIGRISRETGIRVIGPNCLGIYNPSCGLTFGNLPKKTGPAALVSQTGGGAVRIITYGNKRGVYFGKAVSYGNAVDLDSTDFIEMLFEDPETKFLGCYIEGVKDVPRFSKVLKKSNEKKPVVMLKVGATEGSREFATSHTGSLAGSEEIWQAFFKQNGVIRVYTLEEIVDQMVALQYFTPPKGNRVAIIGRGGGAGVVATEICEKTGFKVPSFSRELRTELNKIIPVAAGTGVRNPVEIGVGGQGASPYYADAFKIIANSSEVDMIITHLNPDAFVQWGWEPKLLLHSLDALIDVFRTLPNPVALVLPHGETNESHEIIPEAWEKCIDAGLAVFRSYQTAAKMIWNLIQYHKFQERS